MTTTYAIDLNRLGHGQATEVPDGLTRQQVQNFRTFDWVRDLALEYGAEMLADWLADGEPDPVTVARLTAALDGHDEEGLKGLPDPGPYFARFAEEHGDELAERLAEAFSPQEGEDPTAEELFQRLLDAAQVTEELKIVFATFIAAPVLAYLADREAQVQTEEAAFAAQAIAVLGGSAPAPF